MVDLCLIKTRRVEKGVVVLNGVWPMPKFEWHCGAVIEDCRRMHASVAIILERFRYLF